MQPPGWPLSFSTNGHDFVWHSNPFVTYGVYTADSGTSGLTVDTGQDAIDNQYAPPGADLTKWYLAVSFNSGFTDVFISDTPTDQYCLLGSWSPDPNMFVPDSSALGFNSFLLASGFSASLCPSPVKPISCFKLCYLQHGISLDGLIMPFYVGPR